MSLVTRQGKGSKLTIQEMDGNLTYLESLATPSGYNNEIQFNSGDTFSSSSDFTYDAENNNLAVGQDHHILGNTNVIEGRSNFISVLRFVLEDVNYDPPYISYTSSEGDITDHFTSGTTIYTENYDDGTSHMIATVKSSLFDGSNTIVTINEDITPIFDNWNYNTLIITTLISSGFGNHIEGVQNSIGPSVNFAHVEGNACYAGESYAHAEGMNVAAIGQNSHAEGTGTTASGHTSHAEGYQTTAYGSYSHSEGRQTTANGSYSHAEGYQTAANGDTSHAEGNSNIANGINSHSEGTGCRSWGLNTHTEGDRCVASGDTTHAEGGATTAIGQYSHAEGHSSRAYLRGMHSKNSNDNNQGQYGNVTVYCKTTDSTTPTDLVIFEDSKGNVDRIVIPNNTIFNFRVLGIGSDANGASATYSIIGVAKNIGGTVTVPVATVTEISDDLTVTGMSATADDTNNALIIRTQGKNATTIKWTAFVEWQELKFA